MRQLLRCWRCCRIAMPRSARRGADPALDARAEVRLEEELRCLVCQNQIARRFQRAARQDLRRAVASRSRAGKSDDEIKRVHGRALRRFRALPAAGQAHDVALVVRAVRAARHRCRAIWWLIARRRRKEAMTTTYPPPEPVPEAGCRPEARELSAISAAASEKRLSIYALKPRFQALLRPLTAALARAGVTANQVTLAAAAGLGARRRLRRMARCRSAGRSC